MLCKIKKTILFLIQHSIAENKAAFQSSLYAFSCIFFRTIALDFKHALEKESFKGVGYCHTRFLHDIINGKFLQKAIFDVETKRFVVGGGSE